ncbi:Amino-acid acetyltransferase, mitochondrial [Chytridiales sp. JEL 0842]|nr:Amino-acid acetyltransferase, mitochondrial [Chytridiales sp. JEL 0842]
MQRGLPRIVGMKTKARPFSKVRPVRSTTPITRTDAIQTPPAFKPPPTGWTRNSKMPLVKAAEQNRELILTVLSAMPSPREAKHYLRRYWQDASELAKNRKPQRFLPLPASSILAPLSPPAQTIVSPAVPEKRHQTIPIPTLELHKESKIVKPQPEPILEEQVLLSTKGREPHIGLVRLDAGLTKDELKTIATTLVQLQRLGLAPVILLHWEQEDEVFASNNKNSWKKGNYHADGMDVVEVALLPKKHRRRRAYIKDDKGGAYGWNFTRAKMMHESLRVLDALESVGGRGVSHYTDIFSWSNENGSKNGGSRLNVNLESVNPIQTALEFDQIPILLPLGTDVEGHGQTTALPSKDCLVALTRLAYTDTSSNSQSQTGKLLMVLNPEKSSTLVKLFLINRRGGLFVDQKPVRFINLADEYYQISQQIHLDDQQSLPTVGSSFQPTSDYSTSKTEASKSFQYSTQLQDLDTIYTVLNALPSSSSAVIAAAAGSTTSLIANLITDKPMTSNQAPFRDPLSPHQPQTSTVNSLSTTPTFTRPTLLRRGLHVTQHTSLSTVDLRKLKKLLEASFGKVLLEKDFWQRIEPIIGSVIVAGDYEGAAIVTIEPDPQFCCPVAPPSSGNNLDQQVEGFIRVPYLDKFAVDPKAQGIGVADVLWKRLCREYPDLVWRSRADNPVNKWYFDRSLGNMLLPGRYWMMFWYGDGGLSRVDAYRRVCSSITASFKPPERKKKA